MCVHASVQTCNHAHKKARGSLLGTGSLLLPYGSCGLQAWWQGFYLLNPSHQLLRNAILGSILGAYLWSSGSCPLGTLLPTVCVSWDKMPELNIYREEGCVLAHSVPRFCSGVHCRRPVMGQSLVEESCSPMTAMTVWGDSSQNKENPLRTYVLQLGPVSWDCHQFKNLWVEARHGGTCLQCQHSKQKQVDHLILRD